MTEPVTRDTVELVAGTVAAAMAEKIMKDIPAALAPKIYEVAEKVSAANEESFHKTMLLVVGVDTRNEDSIRNFRQTLDWAHGRRRSEEVDRRVMRTTALKTIVQTAVSGGVGAGLMAFLIKLV